MLDCAAGVWASEELQKPCELSEHFFIFSRSHYEHLSIQHVENLSDNKHKHHTVKAARDHWASAVRNPRVFIMQPHLSRSNKSHSNTSFDLSEELCNISLHATASVFLFPSCPTSCFYLCFNRNTQAALICMYRWSFATQLDTKAKVKLNSLMPFIDEWKQHMLLIHLQMMYINLRAPHNAAWPFCNYQGDRSDAYRSLTRVHSQHFDCNRHRLTVFNLELNTI